MPNQPVAGRLGSRFYDWQLAQPADETFCTRHLYACNLLGELYYARLLREVEHPSLERTNEPPRQMAERCTEYDVDPCDDHRDFLE